MVRAGIACVIAFAVVLGNMVPAWAVTPSGTTPEALQALELLQGACERESTVEHQLPEIRSMLTRAGRRSLTLANAPEVGSSRVDLQACKLEYSIVSPK